MTGDRLPDAWGTQAYNGENVSVPPPPATGGQLSRLLRTFVSALLPNAELSRLPVSKMLLHAELVSNVGAQGSPKQAIDLVRELLKVDPADRLGTDAAMKSEYFQ